MPEIYFPALVIRSALKIYKKQMGLIFSYLVQIFQQVGYFSYQLLGSLLLLTGLFGLLNWSNFDPLLTIHLRQNMQKLRARKDVCFGEKWVNILYYKNT